MICKRCGNDIPDKYRDCPICGTLMVPEKSWKLRLAAFTMTAADLLVIIMSFLNLMILILSAHYAVDSNNGTMYSHIAYFFNPLMATVDVTFGIMLAPCPLFSVLGKYEMKKTHMSGLIKMTVAHCGLFIWSITYPIFSYLITNTVSPIMNFAICQIAVYALLSAAMLIYLWRLRHELF